MLNLTKGYTSTVTFIDKRVWEDFLCKFEDANLYQTISYEMPRKAWKDVAHIILRKNGKLVAASQVRVYRIPATNIGIAYVLFGPMWHITKEQSNLEVFRQAVRSIRLEFSTKRGLLVRLFPIAYRNFDNQIEEILKEEGFYYFEDGKLKRTLILDLSPSLSDLRANLLQKWRNQLNSSERNNLELIVGDEDLLISKFAGIYQEMLDRKGLDEPPSDVKHLRIVQRYLPSKLKFKVILCYQSINLCAGGIFSTIGKTGLYLAGATSNVGMATKASYLVQWTFVKWLKQNDFKYYDLNGINPDTNPGNYRFKKGLAGKKGIDVNFLGKYQVADNPISALIISGGESLVSTYKKLKRRLVKGKS